MRVAPIIHTRTYSCDFNSEFIVRPDTFMDSDIKWARKNVLNATTAIDAMHGERWLIVDNGKYRIAGIVGFLKNICEKCNLADDELDKSQSLFCDDKGRLVYAFIGVVIDKKNTSEIGKITYDYLWRKYLELIFPVWKRTYQEVILKNFEDEDFAKIDNQSIDEAVKIGEKKLYEVNSVLDLTRFEYYLKNITFSNFSFCSNLIDFKAVKESDFTFLTTSQNIIARMNRVVSSNEKDDTSFSKEEKQLQSISEVSDSNEKKNFPVSMLYLLILVIIILILLLQMGK